LNDKKLNNTFIDEIVNIHKKSILELWDRIGKSYSLNEVENDIKEVLKFGEIWGYYRNNNLVGVVGFRTDEINFLLVDSTYHKKGIGKGLLQLVKDKLRGKLTRIFLKVLVENPAVKFYEKFGYKIISQKNKYYTMEKFLD